MSQAEVSKAADMIEKGVYADQSASINLYADAAKYMEGHIDSRKEQEALSKELEKRCILGEVIFDNLQDDVEDAKPFAQMLGFVTKDDLNEMSVSGEKDSLTQLAALSAASKMDDDDLLNDEILEDVENSRIASELLEMFPSQEDWKDIANDDGNLQKSELVEQIGNDSWSDKERETLQRLLDNFWDFKDHGSVSYDDVEDEVDADVAFRYPEYNYEKGGAADKENEEEEEGESEEKDEDVKTKQEKKQEKLVDILEDKDSTIEKKLAAVEQLAKAGVTEFQMKDADGKTITCKAVVEPVAAGSDRKYVHLFAIDDSGSQRIVIRAIGNGGKYEKERDNSGNQVGYVGSWWSTNHPASAISA